MKKIKSALRLCGIVLILLIASIGIGISGAVIPNTKEKYRDRKVLIERVDKEEEDEDESQKEKKN